VSYRPQGTAAALAKLEDALVCLEGARRAHGKESPHRFRKRVHRAQYLLDLACVDCAEGDVIGTREEA
jgi:hypothetical protein